METVSEYFPSIGKNVIVGARGESPKPQVSGFVNGELHPTNYHRLKTDVICRSKVLSTWAKAYGGHKPGDPMGSGIAYESGRHSDFLKRTFGHDFLSQPSMGSSNQLALAETRALNRLLTGEVDLTPTLAESIETTHYLASKSADLAEILRTVKTGQLRKQGKKILSRFKRRGVKENLDKVSKSVSSRYLEYRFAIRPLASDVASLYELSQYGLQPSFFVTASASQRSKTETEKFYSNGYHTKMGWNCSIVKESIHRVEIVASISDPQARAKALLGMSDVQNSIMRGAWELVPYSFMVDYALGIGDYLRALCADTGLNFVEGTKSHRLSERVVDAEPTPPMIRQDGYQKVQEGGKCRYELESYKRLVYSSFPVPSVAVKSPFSTSNVLAAVAIINQLRR